MSDIKLFNLQQDQVAELQGRSADKERDLQRLLERNLESFLGVRFLASEYSTGKTHGGRIDTLGIDENGCPVIIEYKKTKNQNVINQGLFYLDWLLDHRGEFELLVLKQLGQEPAEKIEWTGPRLLCIAGDFTKYDEHAVQLITRNIELIRYRFFGDQLLLLELVNFVSTEPMEKDRPQEVKTTPNASDRNFGNLLDQADETLASLYASISEELQSFGDDVQIRTLKHYQAFRRLKNFACLEVHPKSRSVVAFVKVDPDSLSLEEGFTRDVRQIGHLGTGDLEITIKTPVDLQMALPLLLQSYEAS